MIAELQRKITRTARTRCVAAPRLELHHRLSQRTAALASAALVMIPSFQAFGVPVDDTPQQLHVIQSVLAAVVLVLSLLRYYVSCTISSIVLLFCGTMI